LLTVFQIFSYTLDPEDTNFLDNLGILKFTGPARRITRDVLEQEGGLVLVRFIDEAMRPDEIIDSFLPCRSVEQQDRDRYLLQSFSHQVMTIDIGRAVFDSNPDPNERQMIQIARRSAGGRAPSGPPRATPDQYLLLRGIQDIKDFCLWTMSEVFLGLRHRIIRITSNVTVPHTICIQREEQYLSSISYAWYNLHQVTLYSCLGAERQEHFTQALTNLRWPTFSDYAAFFWGNIMKVRHHVYNRQWEQATRLVEEVRLVHNVQTQFIQHTLYPALAIRQESVISTWDYANSLIETLICSEAEWRPPTILSVPRFSEESVYTLDGLARVQEMFIGQTGHSSEEPRELFFFHAVALVMLGSRDRALKAIENARSHAPVDVTARSHVSSLFDQCREEIEALDDSQGMLLDDMSHDSARSYLNTGRNLLLIWSSSPAGAVS